MSKKDKIRLGVLRGGTDKRYFSSIFRGGDVISHLFENLSDEYKVLDILIDKNGDWYLNGMPISPVDLTQKMDIVWNFSHHPNLSTILENLVIPKIDNGSFPKILEKNNEILRKHMKEIGVKVPRSLVIPLYQEDFDGPREKYSIKKAKEVFEKFPSPWIVRSYTPDANEGVHLAKTFPELVSAIEDSVKHGNSILVEEFISGKPVSSHSVSGLRGENIYVLPSVDSFLTREEKENLFKTVKNIHDHLNIKYYLKSDFILHPKRGLFLNKINLLPDLRKDSHLQKSCEYIGIKGFNLVKHLIEKALND